jgi:hypothetical protein
LGSKLGTEQERKSTRFSRWRERRRREKARDSEIKRELKAERARREKTTQRFDGMGGV